MTQARYPTEDSVSLWRVVVLLWFLSTAACAMQLGTEQAGILDVRKGFRYLGADVEGNTSLFLSNNQNITANALTGGLFQQTLKVDVDMEVLPHLQVKGKFDDTAIPAKQQLSVDYSREALQVTGGDITVGFVGAEFPMESQSLFGLKGRYRTERESIAAIAAKVNGIAGHWEGQGDGTKGPYFLPNQRLIQNSDLVYVDGIRKFRGTDYSVDYLTGVINFMQPVDTRMKMAADYQYEQPVSMQTDTLLASHFAGEVTTNANVGFSVGTRGGGAVTKTDLVGADGHVSFTNGISVGGEVALSKTGETSSQAVRAEAAGTTLGANWTATGRVVQPDFQGLGTVTARRDTQDLNLAVSYNQFKNLKLSTRASNTNDNVDQRDGQATTTDRVLENSAVYTLPRATRVELTFDTRQETHSDDLPHHLVDNEGGSFRLGTRYRIREHMIRASYEHRTNTDFTGLYPLETTAHIGNTQLQSRLGPVFSTLTLQLTRAADADGKLATQETMSGVELSASLHKHVASSASYTLQDRTGINSGRTHSAVASLRSQALKRVTAEVSFQLKETVPEVGTKSGDALLSGRASYRLGSKADLVALYQRRLSGVSTVGPVTVDVHGNVRPAKQWSLAGGYKIDQLYDPLQTANSYYGRIAYMEATMNF